MNPPFGDFSLPSRDYGDSAYADCSRELYAVFVERGVTLTTHRGMLGAITSRTGFSLKTVEQWRRRTLLSTGISVSAELGEGLLDTAMVETAAYVLGPKAEESQNRESLFLRLAGEAARSDLLYNDLTAIRQGVLPDSLHIVRPLIFQDIPGCPIAYWISPRLLSAFSEYSSIEGSIATVKVGLQTGDDFRFVRSFWEVSPNDITTAGGDHSKWVPHAKGGENSPFYSDIHLVVKWHGDGKEIREHPSSTIRNSQFYFKEGLTFPYRTFRFSPSVLPRGCITGVAGMGVFPKGVQPDVLAALLNSGIFNEFISIWLERLDMDSLYQAGKIQPVPVPSLTGKSQKALSNAATTQIRIRRAEDSLDETTRSFVSPFRCVSRVGLLV